MDAEVNQSASETGGERHIQFVTSADCSLDVAHVVLSSTGDDDFGNTIGELISQGYDDAGRKYHVWMDANVLCGVGTIYGDDFHGPGNANNSSVSYARSDTGCWDYAELHELFHNLGAVQLSAPHSSGGIPLHRRIRPHVLRRRWGRSRHDDLPMCRCQRSNA